MHREWAYGRSRARRSGRRRARRSGRTDVAVLAMSLEDRRSLTTQRKRWSVSVTVNRTGKYTTEGHSSIKHPGATSISSRRLLTRLVVEIDP